MYFFDITSKAIKMKVIIGKRDTGKIVEIYKNILVLNRFLKLRKSSSFYTTQILCL